MYTKHKAKSQEVRLHKRNETNAKLNRRYRNKESSRRTQSRKGDQRNTSHLHEE